MSTSFVVEIVVPREETYLLSSVPKIMYKL